MGVHLIRHVPRGCVPPGCVPPGRIIFSPAKVQRARERKAKIEAQEQVEEARKQREKAERKLRKEQ
jgi:hypothetical protein